MNEEHPLQEITYKSTDDAPQPIKNTSPFLYVATTVVNLISFASGIALGWTSPVLPELENADNQLERPLTQSEGAWVAGLLSLGAIFGPLLSGPMADRFGRKKTLLVVSLPMTISFLMLTNAGSFLVLCIARILVGVGVGSVFTVLPTYVAEISEDHNRGTLGCFMGVFLSAGLLFAFSIGPYLSIRNFCLVSCLPLCVFMTAFSIWIPESPHFLASIDNKRALALSLSKLRVICDSQLQNETSRLHKVSDNQTKTLVGSLVKTKRFRKGITLSLGLVVLQQLAGINPVIAYMETIFKAAETAISPQFSAVVIASLQLLTTILTSFLADRLGRRVLLITSSIGSCISLISLGVYFYLQTNKYHISAFISWLPVASLVTYIVAFNIGLGPLPWAITAEIFPSNAKSLASTLTSLVCFAVSFLITLFFPTLSRIFGMAQSFWIFAAFCLIGTIFIYCLLPETKGRSLQDILTLLE